MDPLKGSCLHELRSLSASTDRIMVGMAYWMETAVAIYAAGEESSGLDKVGLITIIVVSVIAITAFIWIFRETGKRD
jgi:hypothetical protein